MEAPVWLAPAIAVFVAAVGAGCGFGSGDSDEGVVRLTVTRDYGAERMLEATRSDPPETETVLSVLDREADIETRYGGGFVQSIDGIEGSFEGGRSFDWFFYVNGVESEIGAAEAELRGGDLVWWDHRDWTEAMRVPAVVGSWPEPFRQASAGSDRLAVRVICAGQKPPCRAAQDALGDAGINSVVSRFGSSKPGKSLRLIVGEWDEIAEDETAGLIARGPEASGVFARSSKGGLELLNERGEKAGTADGLVAATRNGASPPTWLVTGTSRRGLIDAVALLDAGTLQERYAVATSDGTTVPLPVGAGSP
ncbi:MAG: DUF4430 domain-containing protein [Solirubrobacterales bacterium]